MAMVETATQEAATPEPATPALRPNIIFILTDDQKPVTHGFEGNTQVRTPNLDRLASEGTLLRRTYVPIPQCAPSRAAMLTGLYPHQNGVLTDEERHRVLRPDLQTFGKVLHDAGYRCGLVGNWYLGNEKQPQGGFEDFWVTTDQRALENKETRGSFYGNPNLWVNGELKAHRGYLTDVLTNYAIQFIEQSSDKPFLLWLNYHAPHEPRVAPPHPETHYDPAAMSLPATTVDDLSTKLPYERRDPLHRVYDAWGRENLLKDLAGYYAMISATDMNIGRIVESLRKGGLDRNTLIIYMSDNGWMLGDHQMSGKGPFFYESLVRMPMLLWWPGQVPAGQVREGLASSLDLFPTFAALAGTEAPSQAAGMNAWPLVTGQTDHLHDRLYLMFAGMPSRKTKTPLVGVVTDRFKYTRVVRQRGEELYDLTVDSDEMRNLAGIAEYSAILRDLGASAESFGRSTGVPIWSEFATSP